MATIKSDQLNSVNTITNDVLRTKENEQLSRKCVTIKIDKLLEINKESQIILNIQDIISNIVKSISEGKLPSIVIRNQRLWNNCNINNNKLELKHLDEAVSLEIKYDHKLSKEFTHIIYLLGRIYKLLMTKSISTKRELYYENNSLFEDQSQVDTVADKVCCLLGVARWEVGLCATSKGLVAGNLFMTTPSGDTVDCSSPDGVSVPQFISSGIHLQSDARFVLVVEKDAAFQKLLEEGFLIHHGPCIMVTGKGYPDLCTRLLVKFIWEQLKLPIYALVDADVYGVDIMCVYRFGSLKQSHIGERLAVPALKWLGVHPSDITELNINSAPLSDSDKRRCQHLMSRPYFSEDSVIRKELKILLEIGRKSEIEDVAKITNGYLTDVYIPMKLSSEQLI
ncbi:meiotic recombination protein SPO11 [Halyomorpha halys]|uniref:meiotic recombination protein SPO11 n=1 Tax=Halyomorpha halys TaxID=286706 RepID=UPI0006D4F23E|nr:meiotic recombination protein SPO11 [Halyomorpha halys]XP_014284521.1 meiotic recombination protein SPO11 [Halyomorpha halys]